MGFPSVCYCVILPKPLILVIQLLDSLRHAMFLSLFYLGLAPSVEDYYALPPLSTAAAATATATAIATTTATPPPLSPPVTASAIKARLRTVRFASSSKIPSSSSSSSSSTTTRSSSSAEFGEEPMCAVCLGPLKAKDEVRELGACCHVFHKGCIDKWVDMGQVTCPLCRAFLLPN